MVDLAVVPADMTAGADAARDAADQARGHDSADELETAAAAVPGASSADWLRELGSSWTDDVEGWADRAAEFGDRIEAAGADVEGADEETGGVFGLLGGLLGGSGEGG